MPNGMMHPQCPSNGNGKKKMSHGMAVKKCMAANPGMSLADASRKVAAMRKK